MKESRLFWNWLFLTTFWLVIMNGYTLVMISQFGIILDLAGLEVSGNDQLELALSGMQYVEANLFGLFFGTFFFGINRLLDRPSINRKSFGQVIFLKSALYFVGLVIVILLMISIFRLLGIHSQEMLKVWESQVLTWKVFIPSFLTISFFILLTNFILQTARKMGPGYFVSTLLGKYHHPVSEKRVFLFIDLQSSSNLAEQLGHIQYSKLIQDSFRELDEVIFKYHAQIYQYVGDEVVLTWEVKKGTRNNRCLKVYFAFMDRIEKRRDYFMKQYGEVPFFKAGAHMGEVTAAEFGNVKRQIAYHGDVLNTASRIQGVCNKYGKALLISDALKMALPPDMNFQWEEIGEVPLKGKIESLVLHGVDRLQFPSRKKLLVLNPRKKEETRAAG